MKTRFRSIIYLEVALNHNSSVSSSFVRKLIFFADLLIAVSTRWRILGVSGCQYRSITPRKHRLKIPQRKRQTAPSLAAQLLEHGAAQNRLAARSAMAPLVLSAEVGDHCTEKFGMRVEPARRGLQLPAQGMVNGLRLEYTHLCRVHEPHGNPLGVL